MEKIKRFIESEKGKDVMIVIIVILVGLGAFELGRLSKESNSSGIKIEYPDQYKNQAANTISSQNSSKVDIETPVKISDPNRKSFFASNRGSKYYSIGCSGGKTIKQENRVYFTTREEAEQAGYELSSSCK